MNWRALITAVLFIPAVLAVCAAVFLVLRLLFFVSPILVPVLVMTGIIWWLYTEFDRIEQEKKDDGDR
jgi:uncharacterized BrkB/YihY/UPF0761 family membrane protein